MYKKRRYNVLFKDDMFCFNEPSKIVLPYLKHKRMGWFGDDNRFTLCALNNIHIYIRMYVQQHKEQNLVYKACSDVYNVLNNA